MNRARAWVLTVAGTCFCAGAVAGAVLPGLLDRSAARAWDADEYFVTNLVEQLQLSSAQADQLRMVLAAKEREKVELIRSVPFEKLPPTLQDDLSLINDRADLRIQAILDEQQRERFNAIDKSRKQE